MSSTDPSSPTSTILISTPPSTTPFKTTTTSDDIFTKEECSPGDASCNMEQIIMVVVCFILSLAIVMCIARILFIYCAYKRRRERPSSAETFGRRQNHVHEVEEVGHPFSYLAEAGFENCGFAEPPPRYDQLFKRDDPPPVYNGQQDATPTAPAQEGQPSNQNTEVRAVEQPTFIATVHVGRSGSQSSAIHSAPVVFSQEFGHLPTGAFGTSMPPHVHVQLQDEMIRSRTSTIQSESGEAIGLAHSTISYNRRTSAAAAVADTNGSQYFDAQEESTITHENLV